LPAQAEKLLTLYELKGLWYIRGPSVACISGGLINSGKGWDCEMGGETLPEGRLL
jgi:hypothetical protein